MSSENHKRNGSDWQLWWLGVLGSAVYAALAPNWVAFGLAALPGAVAVLLKTVAARLVENESSAI